MKAAASVYTLLGSALVFALVALVMATIHEAPPRLTLLDKSQAAALQKFLSATNISEIAEVAQKDGYIVIPLLDKAEVESLSMMADSLCQSEQPSPAGKTGPDGWLLQMDRFALEIAALQALAVDPRLLAAIGAILGHELNSDPLAANGLALDYGVVLASNEGAKYLQGWHRDMVALPDADAAAAMLHDEYFWNNVQVNVALADSDECFWAVSGSHKRAFTDAESQAFAGRRDNEYAPSDALMPGGALVAIPAGSAVLYDNNLIHRGYCEVPAGGRRRTLHANYHSMRHPPTFHIHSGGDLMSALLRRAGASDPDRARQHPLERLDARFEKMLQARARALVQHPTVASWEPPKQ